MASPSLPERLRRRLRRSVLAPLDARVGGAIRRRRNAGRRFQPVFVTGAMGSGTTLLAMSLGQRFDFGCVIPESAHQVARDSFLHHPGVDTSTSVRAYEASILPDRAWSPARGCEDLLDLYRSHATGESPLALDKGPNVNLVRAEFLGRCFPDAQFVAVFRDPVATVEGFRRKWPVFGNEPLAESIRFYARIHERFLEQTATLGERVAVVEYEVLVARFDAVVEELGRRMHLPAAERRRRLPQRGNVEGRGIRNVERSRIGVVADANARAYQKLEAEEIATIQDQLEPLRDRLRAVGLRV